MPRAVGKDPARHAGLWPGKTPDDRHPPTLLTLGRGRLDFLDVHFYRTDKGESVEEAFRLNLGSTGFFTPELAAVRRAKPVILGEFGAFDTVESSFTEAVRNMARVRDLANRERLNGQLYWTYDCLEQPGMFPASIDWPLFVQTMGNFGSAPNDGQPAETRTENP